MATVRIKLWVDLQRRALVKSDQDGQQINLPDFRQHDRIQFELALIKPTRRQTFNRVFPADATIRLAIGEPGSDELARSPALSANANKEKYVGIMPLNTDRMETAIGNKGSITRQFELEAGFGGRQTTLLQVPVRIWSTLVGNALLRAESGSVLQTESGGDLQTQSQEQVTISDPEHYDKGQMDSRFVGYQMNAGEGLTFQGIDGSPKGTLYLDNNGNLNTAL